MSSKKWLTFLEVTILIVLGWFLQNPQKLTALNSLVNKPHHPVSSSVSSSSPQIVSESTNMDDRLLDANTEFGFALFKDIIKQNPADNLLISPSSIAIALTMTYNGASGATQQAMANTLKLQGMSLDQINLANQNLYRSISQGDPKIQIAIANSLWAKQGIDFKPEFLANNKEFYEAEVTNLDFKQPNSVKTINNWVSQKTEGKITEIIDSIDPNDILFLINAIYFKGTWTSQFDPKLTTNQPFHLADGSSKPHPLMSKTGDYLYYENDLFQSVVLPYGEGGVSMYLFLPRENQSLDKFYQQLNLDNWQKWLIEYSERPGSLKMPRFKLESDLSLNQTLAALGMTTAFDPNQADFSNMSNEKAYLSEVKHKAVMEVNEEGTEAAAVTSVGVRATSMDIEQPPFTMNVDRPFFCIIRDEITGTILFMGKVGNPQ